MHRNDVLVVKIGDRLGFRLKTPHQIGVPGGIQHLNSDYAANGPIQRAVDLPAAAASDVARDLIPSDPFNRGWRGWGSALDDRDTVSGFASQRILRQRRFHFLEQLLIAAALPLDKSIPFLGTQSSGSLADIGDALAPLGWCHCAWWISHPDSFSPRAELTLWLAPGIAVTTLL
jgi:hypothetical protein